MSTTSKCPKCDQAVTIPDGIDPQCAVRCPLCAVEYPMSEALATAPPALIPVDVAVSAPSAASAAADVEPPDEETPLLDVWKKVKTPEIDLGGATAVPDDDFDGFAGEEPSSEGTAVTPSFARPRRRKSKEKSGIRWVLESLLGGFMGLVLGYYLLNLCFGAQFNLLKIPLPFCPHTYKEKAESDEAPSDACPDLGSESLGAMNPQGEQAGGRHVLSAGESIHIGPDGQVEDEWAVDPKTEPKPEPEPEPKTEPVSEDYVGPLNVPSFTSDELGEALKVANDAINGEKGAREIDYDTLCRLGHVLAFVKGEADDTRLLDRKRAVETILERIAEASDHLGKIGRQAADLVEDVDSPNGGILLAGTVGTIKQRNGLYATTVRLSGHPMSVVVMSDRPLPLEEKAFGLLLGSIVSNPAANLAGYSGSKPFVVWLGTAVSVPQP